jgi:hypothetical protein
MCDAHGLGDLYQRAIIQSEFIAFLHLVAVLVVCIAQKVSCLVVHHNSAVERVELEISILPSFLLSFYVLCVQAPKFGDRRAVLGGGDGCDGGRILRATGGRHGVSVRLRRVVLCAGDMEAGSCWRVKAREVTVTRLGGINRACCSARARGLASHTTEVATQPQDP